MRISLTAVLMAVVLVGSAVAQQRQRAFPPRGVELSEAQQAKAEEIQAKFADKVRELQRGRRDIFTDEQSQARREALRKASDENKDPREARRLAEAAVELTDDQQKQLAELQQKQQQLQAEMRRELLAVLTEAQRRTLDRRGPARGPRIPPTHADVKYGPHDRNVMDVWLAESDKPTPVLVSIHGGGFRGGNKSVDAGLLNRCLENGISVVAITYRLSQHAIAPAPFQDSARAIQFIRSKAGEWNLDGKRMAATGGSAGAGISLWLGFHDDMAQPDSDDPVARQSTRLSCMAVFNGQTSYDPRVIRKLFPENETYKESALAQLYGVDLDKLDELPKDKYELFEECSALPHLTKDDPPALLSYGTDFDTPITNQSIGIHHPRFGKMLKEKMDELGIECTVRTRSQRGGGGEDPTLAFIKKHFGM